MMITMRRLYTPALIAALALVLTGCPLFGSSTNPPTALFATSVRLGEAPLEVTFTSQAVAGTDALQSIMWDFGDGTTSTEAAPAHTYTEPGTYTVRLTATSVKGDSNTLTKRNHIIALDTVRVEGTPGEERQFAGIDFIWVPPGTFRMGSDVYLYTQDAAQPAHDVTITRGFWLSKYEVTQSQWRAVMGSNPSFFNYIDETDENRLAVEQVTWVDCQAFVTAINKLGHGLFRLPTEAEWEYACRAGTTTLYSCGDSATVLLDYAWFWNNSPFTPKLVGLKLPNPWGFYDIHGNLAEWVADYYYVGSSYGADPVVDPVGLDNGPFRIVRGGAYRDVPLLLACASRQPYIEHAYSNYIGFRLVHQ